MKEISTNVDGVIVKTKVPYWVHYDSFGNGFVTTTGKEMVKYYGIRTHGWDKAKRMAQDHADALNQPIVDENVRNYIKNRDRWNWLKRLLFWKK